MRKLLPMLSLAALGCASDYVSDDPPPYQPLIPPRPLKSTMQVDRVVQALQPEVDVLWVIDDSASALDEQTQLADHFPAFLRYFQGIDYHVGVVTTDMQDPTRKGRLVERDGVRFIDPETPGAMTTFAKMANTGTGGSGLEQGNDATYAALFTESDGHNAGFLRDASGVHVIVVSDEQDLSEIAADELASHLEGLRTDPDAVTHSSIVHDDARYVDVTHRVGGIVWDVADPDWTPVLENLGLQATGLEREFFLSQLPVPETVRVSVLEGDLTWSFEEGEDWAYDPIRNSIVFHDYVPNPMAEVVLEYQPLSSHDGV